MHMHKKYRTDPNIFFLQILAFDKNNININFPFFCFVVISEFGKLPTAFTVLIVWQFARQCSLEIMVTNVTYCGSKIHAWVLRKVRFSVKVSF